MKKAICILLALILILALLPGCGNPDKPATAGDYLRAMHEMAEHDEYAVTATLKTNVPEDASANQILDVAAQVNKFLGISKDPASSALYTLFTGLGNGSNSATIQLAFRDTDSEEWKGYMTSPFPGEEGEYFYIVQAPVLYIRGAALMGIPELNLVDNQTTRDKLSGKYYPTSRGRVIDNTLSPMYELLDVAVAAATAHATIDGMEITKRESGDTVKWRMQPSQEALEKILDSMHTYNVIRADRTQMVVNATTAPTFCKISLLLTMGDVELDYEFDFDFAHIPDFPIPEDAALLDSEDVLDCRSETGSMSRITVDSAIRRYFSSSSPSRMSMTELELHQEQTENAVCEPQWSLASETGNAVLIPTNFVRRPNKASQGVRIFNGYDTEDEACRISFQAYARTLLASMQTSSGLSCQGVQTLGTPPDDNTVIAFGGDDLSGRYILSIDMSPEGRQTISSSFFFPTSDVLREMNWNQISSWVGGCTGYYIEGPDLKRAYDYLLLRSEYMEAATFMTLELNAAQVNIRYLKLEETPYICVTGTAYIQ